MNAFLAELLTAFELDQLGCGVGKDRLRIGERRRALRLDENRPAGAKPPQRIVEPRRHRDQLGRRGAVEIGTAKTGGALKAAVLVEDGTGCDQRDPRSEEHTSELQSLMRISYAVFCLKKKKK